MQKTLITYWKTIFWVITMSYLLFSPGSTLPETKMFEVPHLDKLVHCAMFAILTLVFLYDTRKSGRNKKRVAVFIVSALLYSVLSELIQYKFIAGRSGNIYDLLADVIGLFMGFIAFQFLKQLIKF